MGGSGRTDSSGFLTPVVRKLAEDAFSLCNLGDLNRVPDLVKLSAP